jgi:hypothetical protein
MAIATHTSKGHKHVSCLRGRFAGRVSQAVTLKAMNEAVQAEAVERRATSWPLRSCGSMTVPVILPTR